MRDFHLRFCADTRGWYDGLIDLFNKDEVDEYPLPQTGGAYVLGTCTTMLIYPWGTSPIFYIGKASNLHGRVFEHKKYIQSARDDHDERYWWPRYQFGAAFGAYVAWYSRRGQEDPQSVEAHLIEKFYDAFGAIPTANSSWPKKIRPKRGSEDE